MPAFLCPVTTDPIVSLETETEMVDQSMAPKALRAVRMRCETLSSRKVWVKLRRLDIEAFRGRRKFFTKHPLTYDDSAMDRRG